MFIKTKPVQQANTKQALLLLELYFLAQPCVSHCNAHWCCMFRAPAGLWVSLTEDKGMVDLYSLDLALKVWVNMNLGTS